MTAFTATFSGSGSNATLTITPGNVIVRAGDTLGFSGIPQNPSSTLTWTGTVNPFTNFTSGSQLNNSTLLTIANNVTGVVPLTVLAGRSGAATAPLCVNAIQVRYVGTASLSITPNPNVKHGDQVLIGGIPAGATEAKLSWTANNLFSGYPTGSPSGTPVSNGTLFTVSSSAPKAMAVITLSFQASASGSSLVQARGKPDSGPTMATGTLDPTGDGEVEPKRLGGGVLPAEPRLP